jgi:hypothetical protein
LLFNSVQLSTTLQIFLAWTVGLRGVLDVSSAVGEGTVFSLRLPLAS